MKRIIALALTGVLALSLAACGTQINKDTASEGNQDTVNVSEEGEMVGDVVVSGGFEKASSPVITDEIKALFEKATDGMTGAAYTPVAYIASQVVAGTNHLVLCKVEAVVPDAVFLLLPDKARRASSLSVASAYPADTDRTFCCLGGTDYPLPRHTGKGCL